MRFFQYDFSEFAAVPAMRFDLATTPGFNPLPEILFHLRPDKEIQPIEFAGKFGVCPFLSGRENIAKIVGYLA